MASGEGGREGGRDRSIEKPYSWLTSVKEIAENDYIPSANTYKSIQRRGTCPPAGREVNHREPKEILGEIEEKEKEINRILP